MPRPLHRSPALWLGLFGLSFIVWAWIDSARGIRQITRIQPGSHLVFEQRDSSLQFRSVKGEPRPALSKRRWSYQSIDYPYGISARLLPGSKLRITHVNGFPYSMILIPHWLILLGYLTVWGGFLCWRQSRHRGVMPGAGPV